MSAYMVSRAHIAYLVAAARQYSRGPFGFSWFFRGQRFELGGTRQHADSLGRLLWEENARSIRERYPDSHEDMVGGVWYAHPLQATLECLPAPESLQVLQACACFEYQACEASDWEESEAFAVVQALRKAAIYRLPGYEDRAWGAPEAWERGLRAEEVQA